MRCLVALLVCAMCGCSKKGADSEKLVTVKGTITGSKLALKNAPPGTGLGQVFLIAESKRNSKDEREASGYPVGMIEREGKFEIREVPPGNYFLAVIPGAGGTPDAGGSSKSDPYRGAFNAKKSPIQVSIPSDKKGGEHDLGSIDLDAHLKKK